MEILHTGKIPVGYEALVIQFGLNTIPHYRSSFVSMKATGYVAHDNNHEQHVYTKHYQLKDSSPYAHLEFALKYDGINLEILTAVFQRINVDDLTQYILKSPSGKYARKIWFLFEWLMNKKLNIADIKQSNYVPLLDDNKYYVSEGEHLKRYRIINNLLGNNEFCPIVRKTNKLLEYEKLELDKKTRDLIEKYDKNTVARAAHYLFTKETISSYAIEHEKPSLKREQRYVKLLETAYQITKIDKEMLLKLQQETVDVRFANFDYRNDQNYVGETINAYRQKIHYISPKPKDVAVLMEGLLFTLDKMIKTKVHPVITAATIAFAFVFIHPFDDGNGRLHRFLIHYILTKTDFTATGIIFPVSTVMLENSKQYDDILETFSIPLLDKIKYEQYLEGEIEVKEDSKHYYQFIDYTIFAEYLFSCIDETINKDFRQELEFIINYDAAKSEIQKIVDMPDRLIDLIIKFIHQNKGKLSDTKRSKYFIQLSNKEINAIETVVREKMNIETR